MRGASIVSDREMHVVLERECSSDRISGKRLLVCSVRRLAALFSSAFFIGLFASTAPLPPFGLGGEPRVNGVHNGVMTRPMEIIIVAD
jgi:hypothetical protein